MIKRAAVAFVASLAVYLTPLVGPHALLLLVEVVGDGLRGGGEPDRSLAAAGVALALAAQAVVFLLVLWFLRRPGWLRALGVVGPILPGIAALNYAYLVALPTWFLVESDTAAELVAWPEECAARDLWMPEIAGPVSLPRGAPLWVAEVSMPNLYALFDPAGCAATPLPLAYSGWGQVSYLAGGQALYVTTAPSNGQQAWFIFDPASGAQTPVAAEQDRPALLSLDGRSVAWLRPVAGQPTPQPIEAVIRDSDGRQTRVVPLSALTPGGSPQLLEVDTEKGELLVARGLSNLYWLGLDGSVRRTLPKPDGVEPQPQTFRLQGAGWVAWDAYRENDPYRVHWSLSDGSGSRQLPKNRSITSLAVSPDGRWIAFSMTSTLSLGSTPDVVVVVRVADGGEAFRRYLPKYTRSSVAFPDPGRFVYTDAGGVHVLKIP